MFLAVILAIAVINADAKLFKKKHWLKKLPLINSFSWPYGGHKEEITIDKPRIVEIVKHVPVIQRVEIIKPVEIIRTIEVPGKKKNISQKTANLTHFQSIS